MKKVLSHISYRLRVSIVVALFALIPFSIFGIFYLKSEIIKWETVGLNEYSQMLAVSSEKLDKGIQELNMNTVYISNSSSIRVSLSQINQMNLIESLDFVYTLKDAVSSITADNKYLSVRWFPYLSNRNYEGYCYTLDTFLGEFQENDPQLTRIMELKNGELLLEKRSLNREDYRPEALQECLCVYSKMSNLNGSQCILEMSVPIEKLLGSENVNLPEGCIYGLCLKLNENQEVVLLSEKSEKAETILMHFFNNGEYPGYHACVSEVDGVSGSKVVCLFPEEYVSGLVRPNIVKFAVIMFVLLFTVLLSSYVVASMLTARVTNFIEMLNNRLDMILEKPSVSLTEQGDFQGIEQRIIKLVQDTQEHYQKLEQYEIEKNRMELELLQMRFNPHFLYNTLASIRYQVKEHTIRKSIDSLIHYYRIVLSKGQLMILIEEEMAMIQEYLELEIFAYRLNHIKYVFEIEENVKSYTIIKHLLQPIVENALNHGLRVRPEDGVLWIRAKKDGEDILFEIEDNGAGMTAEQIKNILQEPIGDEKGGYGIYNVQQRIVTYYGNEYGLAFHSELGKGTLVTLRIPQN